MPCRTELGLPPSALPGISPPQGEIDKWPKLCAYLPFRQAVTLVIGGNHRVQPISPLWGRCPAGQRGCHTARPLNSRKSTLPLPGHEGITR
ncbi:hypothetical protein RHECNPAF_4310096 [Rhizobium etli CNPAF512]|nr:hypothetical protein RHECNPAF_4310096 [Rhizobium etli CNPAF512]